MSEHTKGPWRVDDLGEAHFLETNHRYGIGSNYGTCRVAKIEGMGAECEANARLIAAAPDLLAVCTELAESAAYWSEYDVPVGIVDRLNAAIAKAKGTT